MSVWSDDLDPRLVLFTIEANYKPIGGYKPEPVSGLLVLSRVGLHFYPFDNRRRDGTVNTSGILHFAFAGGKLPHPFRLGYLAAWGSGYGEIVAGISNLAHRVAAKDEGQVFREAMIEAEQQAPPLPEAPDLHPYLVRMNYFADASALGPALHFADRALAWARIEEVKHPSPKKGDGLRQPQGQALRL